MQITVTIPDELAAQVQARGLVLETYVRELMEEKLSMDREAKGQKQQAVEAMLNFSERHGVRLDSDDLKNMIHEGHKY